MLNVTLPFAHQMLAKTGEFYPFAAAVTVGGETRLTAPEPGQDGHPASAEVLSSLFDALRQDRAELRAVAICSDVLLQDSSAVSVELEHRDGQAMAVLLPYKKKRLGRGIDYSQLRGGRADQHVWT